MFLMLMVYAHGNMEISPMVRKVYIHFRMHITFFKFIHGINANIALHFPNQIYVGIRTPRDVYECDAVKLEINELDT